MSWDRNSPLHLRFLIFFPAVALLFAPPIHASDHTANQSFGRRVLLSFKEKPRGGNVTFDCSPSGPCVPCLYSEKNDEKYRCSETGYRIPFKCVEIKHVAKNENGKQSQPSRSAMEILSNNSNLPSVLDDDPNTATIEGRVLVDDSSTVEGGSQAYITYRSCIPAADEEKLSILGFEGTVLCLLVISGSFVYYRRKQSVNAMSGAGAGRIQMNSRF